MKKLPLSLIDERLYYDTTSTTFLKWKSDIGVKIKANSNAGYVDKNNYSTVGLNGNNYLISRIVFYLNNRIDPYPNDIDHIDGNPSNHTISNLRMVTTKVNCRNRKKRNDNSTGVTGVSLFEHKSGRQKGQKHYLAQCVGLNGKYEYKSFALLKYGEQLAFKLACEWREKRIQELNSNGEGYTERHGL